MLFDSYESDSSMTKTHNDNPYEDIVISRR